jgi:uncharacterized membrane protein
VAKFSCWNYQQQQAHDSESSKAEMQQQQAMPLFMSLFSTMFSMLATSATFACMHVYMYVNIYVCKFIGMYSSDHVTYQLRPKNLYVAAVGTTLSLLLGSPQNGQAALHLF